MYNVCIIKPNKNAFSETFIQEHINRLSGDKVVLYGGAFPVYDDDDNYLIKSKIGLLSYLIQKRIFKKKNIGIRTRALKNYLLAKKIDVVFAEYGMVGALVTEACSLAGVPLIVHFHGADVHHDATVAAYSGFYKKTFNYASYLVAVSNDMVDALIALGAPAKKIFNLPCGVDSNKFSQIDVLNTQPNFLSIGRFVEKKSPGSVIMAFKLVVEQLPQAKLTMVGHGPLFAQAEALITQLGLKNSVTLAGVLNTAQIKELMAQSRCFVQHSVTAGNGDKEGTPVTVLEASSCGLPIVSTLHAGIKEAVINGKTGYLVPEHDIEGMAGKMLIFARDAATAASFGAEGRKHILAKYDINYSIAGLDKLISDSVAAKQK